MFAAFCWHGGNRTPTENCVPAFSVYRCFISNLLPAVSSFAKAFRIIVFGIARQYFPLCRLLYSRRSPVEPSPAPANAFALLRMVLNHSANIYEKRRMFQVKLIGFNCNSSLLYASLFCCFMSKNYHFSGNLTVNGWFL